MLFDIESDSDRFDSVDAKKVVALLESGKFPLHSLIYSYESNQWTPIDQCEPIARLITLKLMKGSISFNNDSQFHHWCLKNIVSPKRDFTLMEIISQLQNRQIDTQTLIGHPSLKGWQKLGDIAIFQARSLQILFQFLELRDSFKVRENFRVKIQKNMFAQKDNNTYHGVCWSLSTQGLGFDTFEKTEFKIGDKISLTLIDFLNGDEAEFECEVVSLIEKVNYDSIGVKFEEACELEETVFAVPYYLDLTPDKLDL